MRKPLLVSTLMVATLVASCSAGYAQSVLDLPRPSQHAQVMQRIGLTDVTISYSRPLVKGRKIFGAMVPYGEVWRAGANENTVIEFSDAVSIEGRPLPKGTYGLHMIPGENEWTVILSKNFSSWGSYSYDQKEDALRVTVKPKTGEAREALAYGFDAVTPDSAVVMMEWDRVAVPFKVTVNQKEIVPAKLKLQLRGGSQFIWEGWAEAADTLLTYKTDLADALEYANKSIQVEKRFENLITKANVLEAMGRNNETAPLRAEALAMGNAMQINSYGRQLQISGHQDEAFAVFRENAKRNPNHFIVPYEEARMAVAKGDYDTAVNKMKVALAGSTKDVQPFLQGLLKRLEAKEDINKN
jgi:tetratricopeptide (TPR) repeat protein